MSFMSCAGSSPPWRNSFKALGEILKRVRMCMCARVPVLGDSASPLPARRDTKANECQNPPPPNASVAKQREIVSEADFSIGGERT